MRGWSAATLPDGASRFQFLTGRVGSDFESRAVGPAGPVRRQAFALRLRRVRRPALPWLPRSERKSWSRVGDGRLDEDLSPLRDGDADRLHCLDRGGRVLQRNAIGLNAARRSLGMSKLIRVAATLRPGICLLGGVRGLADPLQRFVRDLDLLGPAAGASASRSCAASTALFWRTRSSNSAERVMRSRMRRQLASNCIAASTAASASVAACRSSSSTDDDSRSCSCSSSSRSVSCLSFS